VGEGKGNYRLSAPSDAGWYVDPGGNGGLRWWDGGEWTDDMADGASVDGAPLPPPGNDRLGDQPHGRPARRAKLRRTVFIGLGIVALFAAGAIVGGAVEHQDAGTPSTNSLIPNPANSLIEYAPTVQVTPGQIVTLPPMASPGEGLYDQQVVRIVATALNPDIQYSLVECESGGSYDAGDCDFSTADSLGADASGTVRIEYAAEKGPFGFNDVTCGSPSSCQLVIYDTPSPMPGPENMVVYLDFG
jgi:hypothetical protein